MSGRSGIEVLDRRLLRLRRERAAATISGADYLLARAADDLIERLQSVKRTFPLGLEIGAAHGLFRGRLASSPAAAQVGTLIVSDFSPRMARAAGAPAFVADEERLPVKDGTLDLALSALALQSTNDLPGALIQIRRALKPDGLFLGALIGGDSLTELRQAFYEAEAETAGGVSPRVAPFIEVRDLGSLLQRAGFALPVVDVDRVKVTYATPLALLADLRAMGETNVVRERRPLKRATLLGAMEIYAERFSEEGRVYATFDILHASGWAPAASQPQPLMPGSARARLADALGTEEVSAGETASPARR